MCEKPSKDLQFCKSRQRNKRTDLLELPVKLPLAQSSERGPRLAMKADRGLKLSERQAKEFESLEKTVNVVKPLKKGTPAQAKGKQCRQQNHHESHNGYQFWKHNGKDEKCRNCGGTYPHKDSCPGKNRKCSSCGKLNHFARVCRTNPTESAKHVTHQDPGEEEPKP